MASSGPLPHASTRCKRPNESGDESDKDESEDKHRRVSEPEPEPEPELVPVPVPASAHIPDRLDELGINSKPLDFEASQTDCPICFDVVGTSGVIQMKNCHKHAFHRACIIGCITNDSLKCPVCKVIYGNPLTGNQPDGTMTAEVYPHSLPGHSDVGAIVITYYFPPSRQRHDHPTPGMPLAGDTRRAFLPNNSQGQEILRLLRVAWERKLIFTVGISLTHGPAAGERIVWNGIHHKTALHGEHGFPDPIYFSRVKDELAQLGVV